MSLSYEQIQSAIVELPPEEQTLLFDELKERLTPQNHSAANGQPLSATQNRFAANGQHSPVAMPDPEPNDRWLAQNANQYRGQWVALENGELLAHGPDGRAFVQAVKATGAKIPLLLFIEEEGKFPEFMGWL